MHDQTTSRSLNLGIAYLVLRGTLGLNIFTHGVSRILTGTRAFANSLLPLFEKTPLPAWSVHAFGQVLPWLEMGVGFLVLIGLRTRAALIGGSFLMFVLTFGTTLRQDWSTAGIQLLYTLVYVLLLSFVTFDWYSVDALVFSAKRRSD